jgi:hypothetical protein
MASLTRDDLVDELQKLSKDLLKSVERAVEEVLRGESIATSPGVLAVKPPPSLPEHLKDEHNEVIYTSSGSPREESVRDSIRDSVRADLQAESTQSLEEEEEEDMEEEPLMFHKGFLAKKVYDDMAPVMGLQPPSPHDMSSHRHVVGFDKHRTLASMKTVLGFHKSKTLEQGMPSVPKITSRELRHSNSVSEEVSPNDSKEADIIAASNGTTGGYVAVNSKSKVFGDMSSLKKAWGMDADVQPSIGGDLRMYGMQKKMGKNGNTARSGKLGPSKGAMDFEAEDSLRMSKVETIQMKAGMLIEGGTFDTMSALGIFLYSLLVGFRTQWGAKNVHKDPPVVFDVFEVFFCICFSTEVAIRLIATYGHFFSEGWKWTVFDLLLVMLQIIDLVVDLVVRATGAAKNNATNLSFVRLLRLLRLIRIVRIVRVVRLMSELRSMVHSIMGSLKSLFFTMILLALLVFVMGIFITQLVTESLRNDLDNNRKHEALYFLVRPADP